MVPLSRFALLPVLALMLAIPPVAGGATRYRVSADLPKAGGGQYLQNKKSGYYLGRLAPGDAFRSQRTSTDSRFNNLYHYGYAYGDAGICAWIGPPADQRNYRSYFNDSRGGLKSLCPKSGTGVGSAGWLAKRDNIGRDFNCPDGQATGPVQTTLAQAAGFFYNLDWAGDYSGGRGVDPLLDPATGQKRVLAAGTTVMYRFRTKDRDKAVVYAPTIGWGFVLASKVAPVAPGYEGASDNPDPVPTKACGS